MCVLYSAVFHLFKNDYVHFNKKNVVFHFKRLFCLADKS